MLLQLDGTLILMAISFIIFMFVMQKIFYSPMTRIRKERDKYIDEVINKARQAKEQAVILEAEYEKNITNARVSANSVVSQRISSANIEKSSILVQKTTKIDEQIKLAKENILKEKNESQEVLKQHLASLAQSISTKILGEEVPISGITPEMINKYMNG
jgi:F-type H+-transporting ATPase subunit b